MADTRASQRGTACLGALALALCTGGCSGKVSTFESGGRAGMADVESGGAGASPQSGGTGGGGSGNEAQPQNPIAGLRLDDTFPWFLAKDGVGSELPPETDATGNPLLHLALSGQPVRATLSTHNHFEVIRYTNRVEFSAKATDALVLRVSARRALDGGDYFAGLEAGQVWPTAEVQVGLGWQRFSVPFSEMKPAEPAAPQATMGSFMIAFIVDHPRGVELFVDDVRFE